MSETLLGIIIGGAIGVLPTIFLAILELWKQHIQQKHELKLKRLELLVAPQIEAYQQYLEQAGALMGQDLPKGFSTTAFVASLEKAAAFADDETRAAMYAAAPVLLEGWGHGLMQSSLDKLSSEKLRNLNALLYRAMRSPFEDADDPACHRN